MQILIEVGIKRHEIRMVANYSFFVQRLAVVDTKHQDLEMLVVTLLFDILLQC